MRYLHTLCILLTACSSQPVKWELDSGAYVAHVDNPNYTCRAEFNAYLDGDIMGCYYNLGGEHFIILPHADHPRYQEIREHEFRHKEGWRRD